MPPGRQNPRRGEDFASYEWVSVVFAVEFLRREGVDIDTLETTYVHSHHRPTVLPDASAERLYAANVAEKLMNHFLVELIIGQMIFSRQKIERISRHETKYRTEHGATRAVAGNGAVEIKSVHSIANRAAMTTSFEVRVFGHAAQCTMTTNSPF